MESLNTFSKSIPASAAQLKTSNNCFPTSNSLNSAPCQRFPTSNKPVMRASNISRLSSSFLFLRRSTRFHDSQKNYLILYRRDFMKKIKRNVSAAVKGKRIRSSASPSLKSLSSHFSIPSTSLRASTHLTFDKNPSVR